MGLPGHRRTSSHKRRRAAHFALKTLQLTTCKNCSARILPHQTCPKCGFYKGRKVMRVGKRMKTGKVKAGNF